MSAYLIVNLEVLDAANFSLYREKMSKLVPEGGGTFLVRGGEMRVLEGEVSRPRVVILGFDSMEAAQAFYDSPEYAPLKALRQATTDSTVMLVDGYSG